MRGGARAWTTPTAKTLVETQSANQHSCREASVNILPPSRRDRPATHHHPRVSVLVASRKSSLPRRRGRRHSPARRRLDVLRLIRLQRRVQRGTHPVFFANGQSFDCIHGDQIAR